MWWLIIQTFPRCRNPFLANFKGLALKNRWPSASSPHSDRESGIGLLFTGY